jgi:DNA-binding transcriptional ArsR family regulator
VSTAVPGESLRLVERLLCEGAIEHGVPVTAKHIARLTGVEQRRVSDALKKLRESGKVERFKSYSGAVASYYQYRVVR